MSINMLSSVFTQLLPTHTYMDACRDTFIRFEGPCRNKNIGFDSGAPCSHNCWASATILRKHECMAIGHIRPISRKTLQVKSMYLVQFCPQSTQVSESCHKVFAIAYIWYVILYVIQGDMGYKVK